MAATVLLALAGAGTAAGAAPAPRCAPVFARGQQLAQPASARVTRIYELRRARANAEPLRLGYVYVVTGGATYYLAETGSVPQIAVDAETAWLRAAGFSKVLATQYTHLTDLPAVPPVPRAFALALRFHDAIVPCP